MYLKTQPFIEQLAICSAGKNVIYLCKNVFDLVDSVIGARSQSSMCHFSDFLKLRWNFLLLRGVVDSYYGAAA